MTSKSAPGLHKTYRLLAFKQKQFIPMRVFTYISVLNEQLICSIQTIASRKRKLCVYFYNDKKCALRFFFPNSILLEWQGGGRVKYIFYCLHH